MALTASSDTLDTPVKTPKTESQEGELRQGRRIFKIVGSPRAGYNLKLKENNTARIGPLKPHERGDEGSLGQVVRTEGDQSYWDAMEGTAADWWEMLRDYMVDSDTEQHQATMMPRQWSWTV